MKQPMRSGRTKSKISIRKKLFLVILGIVGLSVLLYVGNLGLSVYQAYNKIQHDRVDASEANEDTNDSDYVEKDVADRDGNTISIAILGIDNEGGSLVGRSDVIMVAAIDLDEQKSTLVSIPRDTYVPIHGRNMMDKINHAHAISLDTSLSTIEDYLNIPIDNYISVNFDAFVSFIDIMGGIELDVERRIFHNLHRNRVYLYPGVQQVNGQNALEYIRFRADYEGDFGRNRRQQQVIRAMVDQTKSLQSITRLPGIIDVLGDNIRTDMSLNEMISLMNNLSSMTGENVESLQLIGRGFMLNGVSYVEIEEEDRFEVEIALRNRLKLIDGSRTNEVDPDETDENGLEQSQQESLSVETAY